MTFRRYLEDAKWLFTEKGMLPTWQRLSNMAEATTQGTTPVGLGAIGNLELDAAGANGFTAAIGITLPVSGQQDYKSSTTGKIFPGVGAAVRLPNTNIR